MHLKKNFFRLLPLVLALPLLSSSVAEAIDTNAKESPASASNGRILVEAVSDVPLNGSPIHGLPISINLYDVKRGKLVLKLPKHLESVKSLDLTPDGQTLATSPSGFIDGDTPIVTTDGATRIWNTHTGTILYTLPLEGFAQFSHDGLKLVTVSISLSPPKPDPFHVSRTRAFIRRTSDGVLIAEMSLMDFDPKQSRIRFNRLGDQVLVYGRTVLERFSAFSGALLGRVNLSKFLKNPVAGLSVGLCSPVVAAEGPDYGKSTTDTVIIDLEKNVQRCKFSSPLPADNFFFPQCFGSEDQWLASPTSNGVSLRSSASGKLLQVLPCDGQPNILLSSPTGRMLVIGSYSRSTMEQHFVLYNLKNKRRISKLPWTGHFDPSRKPGLFFSADGKVLVVEDGKYVMSLSARDCKVLTSIKL